MVSMIFYERIFNFIVLILRFINKLPKTYSNHVIIGQITRSVTSVGANSQEADGTNTKKTSSTVLPLSERKEKKLFIG